MLLLGVSYKAGVGDMREAPALKIAHLLRAARRRGLLPRPARRRVPRARPAPRSTLADGLGGCDVACVITAHPEFDYARVVAEAPLVVDFRGVTRGIAADNLIRL